MTHVALIPRTKALVRRALPVWLLRRRNFRKVHGRPMPLVDYTTFTDKVAWRIGHDRRELLAPTCDKLAMKAHAQRVASDLVRVPRTLWSGTDVRELAGARLTDHWVLKPNHSSQLVHFGQDVPDVDELRRVTAGWLEAAHWRQTGEWAYRLARPLLIVEEHIGVPGVPPDDIKVLTFDGVPRMVQVHSGRFTEQRVRPYTPSWEPIHRYTGYPQGPDVPRPARLGQMLEAAGRLAEGFDMLRVDFFETGDALWFGELTPYPGAGMTPLDPELDAWLGSWWTLPGHGLARVSGDARRRPPDEDVLAAVAAPLRHTT